MNKMTIKFLSFLGLLAICVSCKKDVQDNLQVETKTDSSVKLNEKEIAKFKYSDFSVDDKVAPLIEPWQEYKQLDQLMLNIKKADLSYFKTDAKKNLKTLLKDLRTHIPDTINTPSVLARISVIETKLYKTESLTNLSTTKKEELAKTIKELLVSFSNLNFQMNKKLEKDSQNIVKPTE